MINNALPHVYNFQKKGSRALHTFCIKKKLYLREALARFYIRNILSNGMSVLNILKSIIKEFKESWILNDFFGQRLIQGTNNMV